MILATKGIFQCMKVVKTTPFHTFWLLGFRARFFSGVENYGIELPPGFPTYSTFSRKSGSSYKKIGKNIFLWVPRTPPPPRFDESSSNRREKRQKFTPQIRALGRVQLVPPSPFSKFIASLFSALTEWKLWLWETLSRNVQKQRGWADFWNLAELCLVEIQNLTN